MSEDGRIQRSFDRFPGRHADGEAGPPLEVRPRLGVYPPVARSGQDVSGSHGLLSVTLPPQKGVAPE